MYGNRLILSHRGITTDLVTNTRNKYMQTRDNLRILVRHIMMMTTMVVMMS